MNHFGSKEAATVTWSCTLTTFAILPVLSSRWRRSTQPPTSRRCGKHSLHLLLLHLIHAAVMKSLVGVPNASAPALDLLPLRPKHVAVVNSDLVAPSASRILSASSVSRTLSFPSVSNALSASSVSNALTASSVSSALSASSVSSALSASSVLGGLSA